MCCAKIIFYFANDHFNNMQNTPLENMQRFKNENHISKTMSGETCWRISHFGFLRCDMYFRIFKLWEIREEFWNGVFCKFLIRAYTCTIWGITPGSWKYTLPKKKWAFALTWRIWCCEMICTQIFSDCKRTRGTILIRYWEIIIRTIVETLHDPRSTSYNLLQKKDNFQNLRFFRWRV